MATYTTHGITVKFDDHSPEVLAALKRATVRGLEACGAKAESYAKQELSKAKLHADGSVRPNVITGRLRDSISHGVKSQGRGYASIVGTNVEYAATVELGGRNPKWKYPYLKPATTEHTGEYKQILANSLKNA